jgi:hypothetical protein
MGSVALASMKAARIRSLFGAEEPRKTDGKSRIPEAERQENNGPNQKSGRPVEQDIAQLRRASPRSKIVESRVAWVLYKDILCCPWADQPGLHGGRRKRVSNRDRRPEGKPA